MIHYCVKIYPFIPTYLTNYKEIKKLPPECTNQIQKYTKKDLFMFFD